MHHKAGDNGDKFALLLLWCRHIGLLFDKRLDSNLLRHRIRKYADSPVHTLSDSLRIYFFSTLKSGFKNFRIRSRIHRMSVDGSRIQKVKVADSKISGYLWTEPYFALLKKQTTGMWSQHYDLLSQNSTKVNEV